MQGFEIARGLLMQGGTVVLGCRDLKKGEVARAQLVADTGNQNAVLMQVDLANLSRLQGELGTRPHDPSLTYPVGLNPSISN